MVKVCEFEKKVNKNIFGKHPPFTVFFSAQKLGCSWRPREANFYSTVYVKKELKRLFYFFAFLAIAVALIYSCCFRKSSHKASTVFIRSGVLKC